MASWGPHNLVTSPPPLLSHVVVDEGEAGEEKEYGPELDADKVDLPQQPQAELESQYHPVQPVTRSSILLVNIVTTFRHILRTTGRGSLGPPGTG